MASMFEEMKKLKKHLQSEKSDTAPQQASSTRAAAVTPTMRMSKCPACDRQFPIEALKKHLVQEYGVAERTSLSDAVAMLSGGKISAQHDDERQKPKPKPVGQNQSRPAHPNNKTAKQPVVRSGQQRKRVEGLDRHKNLDGYTE